MFFPLVNDSIRFKSFFDHLRTVKKRHLSIQMQIFNKKFEQNRTHSKIHQRK